MKLLVALDLSDATPKIIDAIGKMTEGHEVEARVLHVAEPDPDFVGYDAGPEVVRDQVAGEFRGQHNATRQAAEDMRAAGIKASAVLIQGGTVDVIIEQAKKYQADFIVMGTHGRSRVVDVLVGGVSHDVLRRSDIPVLLVPTR